MNIKFPVEYDESDQCVYDADGHFICDTDGANEDVENANERGNLIARAMNEAHERDSAGALEVGARYQARDGDIATITEVAGRWIYYDRVTPIGETESFSLLQSQFLYAYFTKLPTESPAREGSE